MKLQRPSIHEQAEYYDRWNLRNRARRIDELPVEMQTQGAKVLELLNSLNFSYRPRILEVGCGTGWLTGKLSEIGECTAVDLSSRAIEIARNRGFCADFIAGDFLEVSLPMNHFDVCISVGSIAYFTDQPALFQKMALLIKLHGYLILTTNNKFVFERRSDVLPPEAGQVRNWLSRRELRKLLRPYFKQVYEKTMFPAGDRGILRIVNSIKINSLIHLVASDEKITWAKEKMGLGHNIVVMAQRRNC